MVHRFEYESTTNRPLWMQEVLEHESVEGSSPLRGHERLDICIVGGGLSGLWTALHIARLEPSARVGVVESDICGAGASGANGGFAMTWWSKFATLRKLMSTDDALRMAAKSQDAVVRIGEFCREHSIEADFNRAGWLWTATNTSQLGSWSDTVNDLAAVGASPFRELSRSEVFEIGGSARHLGGVMEEGVATLHPGALVRGLRRAALGAGVQIWEKTPMLRFESSARSVRVHLPAATITTDHLVLATNAWLVRYREIRRHLLVLGSDVVATAPAPEVLAALHWTPGLAISDSRRLVQYYRPTVDGRVIFGKGGGRIGFRSQMNRSRWSVPLRATQVVRQLHATYPELRNVAISNTWSGAVDYSSDSVPFFNHLGTTHRVHYGVGFSGNGVGPSYIAGQILASMALERDAGWTNPLIRTPKIVLPPEPFRALGGRIVRGALRSKERSDDRGTEPSMVIRRLTQLDPTSFVG